MIYFILFIVLLWLGQFVSKRLVRRSNKGLMIGWLCLVLLVQGVVICLLMQQVIDFAIDVLKLFYNE